MSTSINEVILIGHLGADPKVTEISEGRKVAKFSVATNREWKNKSGDQQKETDWHNIECWGSLAQNVGQYLTKGRQVVIQGRLKTDQYESDGAKKFFTKVVARSVGFLGGRTGTGEGTEEMVADASEEEIPF